MMTGLPNQVELTANPVPAGPRLIEEMRAGAIERRQRRRSKTATVNLAAVDLNLLVALDALLARCNVTHAASVIGLSQPAMSRILARLRGMFDDDILVRTSAGYVRTLLGERLHRQLPTALDGIRRIVSPRSPAAEGLLETVRMAMPDHQALLIGKEVGARLAGAGNSRELAIEPLAGNVLRRLEAGDLDLAVGELAGEAVGFFQRSLFVDDHLCLLRPGHPALDRPWTLDEFRELHHVLRPEGHDCERDHVADALTKGARRSHCTISPNSMAAAIAVAETDMVLTLPRRAAARLARVLDLRAKAPPPGIAPYRVVLLWHERSHRDPEHEWIRSQVVDATNASATCPQH